MVVQLKRVCRAHQRAFEGSSSSICCKVCLGFMRYASRVWGLGLLPRGAELRAVGGSMSVLGLSDDNHALHNELCTWNHILHNTLGSAGWRISLMPRDLLTRLQSMRELHFLSTFYYPLPLLEGWHRHRARNNDTLTHPLPRNLTIFSDPSFALPGPSWLQAHRGPH